MTLSPRAVVVSRCTELETLIAHHGTRQQAFFFLRSRDRDPEQLVAMVQWMSRYASRVATVGADGRAIDPHPYLPVGRTAGRWEVGPS